MQRIWSVSDLLQNGVLYAQKLTGYLRAVIKYLIIDGVRSVIGSHLRQLNGQFTQICAGGEGLDPLAEDDKAYVSLIIGVKSGSGPWLLSGFWPCHVFGSHFHFRIPSSQCNAIEGFIGVMMLYVVNPPCMRKAGAYHLLRKRRDKVLGKS